MFLFLFLIILIMYVYRILSERNRVGVMKRRAFLIENFGSS